MRPCASVAGTRCTRCTPLSYFSLLYAPRPSMVAMTSLTPPTSLSLVDMSSTRQPCFSANFAVHAEELVREQRGFFAARAGANFEHHVLLVVRILRDEENLDARRSARRAAASRPSSSSCASSRMSASSPLRALRPARSPSGRLCTRGISRRAARFRRAPSRACGTRSSPTGQTGSTGAPSAPRSSPRRNSAYPT